MTIETRVFGEVSIDPTKIIHFENGIGNLFNGYILGRKVGIIDGDAFFPILNGQILVMAGRGFEFLPA